MDPTHTDYASQQFVVPQVPPAKAASSSSEREGKISSLSSAVSTIPTVFGKVPGSAMGRDKMQKLLSQSKKNEGQPKSIGTGGVGLLRERQERRELSLQSGTEKRSSDTARNGELSMAISIPYHPIRIDPESGSYVGASDDVTKTCRKESLGYCEGSRLPERISQVAHKTDVLAQPLDSEKKMGTTELNDEQILVTPVIEKKITEPASLVVPEVAISPISIQATQVAFGKAQWEKYFRVVVAEPPLPTDIDIILNNPCPFFLGKKVGESHMLVLIPRTVGQFQWVLMTKDVIKGSRGKNYEEQKALIADAAGRTNVDYEVPGYLDAFICILSRYVSSGERLFSSSPFTVTRCKEIGRTRGQLMLGGYTEAWFDRIVAIDLVVLIEGIGEILFVADLDFGDIEEIGIAACCLFGSSSISSGI